MPDRIFREAAWIMHPKLTRLDARARDFLLRFLLVADDYHVFSGDPVVLCARLYPREPRVRPERDVKRYLQTCSRAGVLRCYEANGELLAQAAGEIFCKPGKRGPQKYPMPPEQQELIPQHDNILPMHAAKAAQSPKPARPKDGLPTGPVPKAEVDRLLEEIAAIAGEKEVQENSGMWAIRIQASKRAVMHAIEDFKVRTTDQRNQIRNRAAWLTDRYMRAVLQLGGDSYAAVNS